MRFKARSKGVRPVPKHEWLVVDHKNVNGEDFSGRTLVKFASITSRFEKCRFEHMRIEDGGFGEGVDASEYIGCSFDGSNIDIGPGGHARFARCSFRDVRLADWFCFTVELVDCVFTGRLSRAYFNGTVPLSKRMTAGRDRNEFTGNDFSGMDLVDVGFRTGVDLTQQRLPSGPPYLYLRHATAAIQQASREVALWRDVQSKQLAMKMIHSLESELEGGPRQLLIREDASWPYPIFVGEA